MKRIMTWLCLCCIITSLKAQIYDIPKHEVRAAWITTLSALDWPRTKANTPDGIARQKAELVEMLDQLKAANFNTVLIQTRIRGTVIYKSDYEPFSSILTGRTNGNPGYDPLAFAIEECHKRGMECHAWIVALPLGTLRQVNALGNLSVMRKHKELTVTYKNAVYMNPGNPKVKEYLWDITREIITAYDVDGVHYDYLRYPERASNFPDRADYRKYGNGRDINQWRRDNISEIVRHIYKNVKNLKPWVKVSTSPVGKYNDTARYSSSGWNAYETVHQDVVGWLNEGIMDQIYPMMYFRGNAFYPFALDWMEQSNGRQVVAGLGIYFMDPKEGNWTLEEVLRQLHFTRANGMGGQAYFRMKFLSDNTQGIYDELSESFYAAPALVPPMTWLDSQAPTAPQGLKMVQNDGGYTQLSWQAATDNDPQNQPRYVVYASDSYPVDTNNARNIVAQNVMNTQYLYVDATPWAHRRYFAVTAIDRYGNESEAAQLSMDK